ncbi:hypothetical protein JOC54_004112 [Alkalihalobacillus xiaoxiensis]|uniref:Uncharacterized protein n=1 Tax=Shouchella xiaoxiensis TaxID=766895 RepID=A0ABS2T2A8_9BACI|nr:hypothetical protein [Shouchella xiaoxiensis]
MPYYLNNLLKEEGVFNHHCILHNNMLIKYELLPIHHRSKSCDKEIIL